MFSRSAPTSKQTMTRCTRGTGHTKTFDFPMIWNLASPLQHHNTLFFSIVWHAKTLEKHWFSHGFAWRGPEHSLKIHCFSNVSATPALPQNQKCHCKDAPLMISCPPTSGHPHNKLCFQWFSIQNYSNNIGFRCCKIIVFSTAVLKNH